MVSRTIFVDTKVVPSDVFTYQDDDFYSLVSQLAGPDEASLLKIQGIRTVHAFLRIPNIFDVFNINSKEVNDVKTRTCFILSNDNYVVKSGIKASIEYLHDLFGKKQGELSKNNNRNERIISNVSSNTTTTPNNSLQTITATTTQLSTTTTNEAIDHRPFIIESINEWCLKHADELGISDLKLVEGIDYVVTLSGDFAQIRCGCRGSARLPKQGKTLQLSNFYRHLKGKRCSMLKAKQQIHNINSNPSNNVNVDEETFSQRTTTENIPILSSDSITSTSSKRRSPLSDINGSRKKRQKN